MAYKKYPKCRDCGNYCPMEKLEFEIFKKACLKYDGWCFENEEERDANEVICTHFKEKNSHEDEGIS